MDLAPVVRETSRRLTLNSRTMNLAASPHLVHGEPPPTHANQDKVGGLDPRGQLVTLPGSARDWGYLQPRIDYEAVQSVIETMWTSFHAITGIPMALFRPGTSTSGVSLERQSLRWLWRVESIQRGIERLIPGVAAKEGVGTWTTWTNLDDPVKRPPEMRKWTSGRNPRRRGPKRALRAAPVHSEGRVGLAVDNPNRRAAGDPATTLHRPAGHPEPAPSAA